MVVSALLSANLPEQGVDRLPPDLVAGLVRMQEVVHHPLGKRTVGLEELVAEIEPEDGLSVGVVLDDGVHLVVGDAALVVRLGAARENRKKRDLRLRMLGADDVEDALYAGGDVNGVAVPVVRADHHGEQFRRIAFELAVFHTPDRMLGAVAAVSEVQDPVGLADLGEQLAPFAALAFPAVGDGVAHHHDVILHRAVVDDLVALLEITRRPVVSAAQRHRRDRPPVLVPGRTGGPDGRDDRIRRGGEHLVDERHHRARPDLVAARVRMEEIGEEFAAEASLRVKKLVAEVAPDHAPAVGERRELLVDHVVAAAERIVRVRAAREDGREDRARVRLLLGDDLEDALHPHDRVDRRLLREREVPGVVRADHEKDALRLVAVELASFGDAPEDMFRAVGARTEVQRPARPVGKVLLPLGLAVSFPEMRDRVADEDDFRAAVRDGRHLLGVALHLPAVRIAVPGGRGDGANRAEGGCRRTGGHKRDEPRRTKVHVDFHGGYFTIKSAAPLETAA